MRHLKIFGLASIAAVGLIAIAVGTAASTEICTVNQGPCPVGQGEMVNGPFEATTSLWVLTEEQIGDVTCTAGAIKGFFTNLGGAGKTVQTSITSFSLSGDGKNGECTLDTAFFGSDPCTFTALNLPWLGELSITAQPDGIFTMKSSGKGNPTLTIKCPAVKITCELSATSIVLDFDGKTPKLTAINEPTSKLSENSEGCPRPASWTATYTVVKPTPSYLVN